MEFDINRNVKDSRMQNNFSFSHQKNSRVFPSKWLRVELKACFPSESHPNLLSTSLLTSSKYNKRVIFINVPAWEGKPTDLPMAVQDLKAQAACRAQFSSHFYKKYFRSYVYIKL